MSLIVALGVLPLAPGAASAGAPLAFLALTEERWQVWTVDADGSNPKQRTSTPSDKTRVSWFPDGRALLVNTGDGELLRVDLEAGEERAIRFPARGMLDATLSPKGGLVAYSLPTGPAADDNDVWIADLSGSEPRKIVAMPGLQLEPIWGRDGEWVYFLSAVGAPERDIWRVRATGDALEKVTRREELRFELAPGPADAIAYSRLEDGDYDVYVESLAAPPRNVTASPGLDGHPTWSPDGEEIAFHSTRGGSLQVWRVDASGAGLERLTNHAGGARSPVWAPPMADR